MAEQRHLLDPRRERGETEEAEEKENEEQGSQAALTSSMGVKRRTSAGIGGHKYRDVITGVRGVSTIFRGADGGVYTGAGGVGRPVVVKHRRDRRSGK